MKSLLQMLHFVAPYRNTIIAGMVMLLGGIVTDLAIPRLMQQIIDHGIAQKDLHMVLVTAGIMVAATFLSAILGIGNASCAVAVSQRFAAALRRETFGHIQRLSFGNQDRLQTGRLLVRLTSDVSQVQQIVMFFLRVYTRAPLLLAGSIVLLFVTNWRLGLIMLVILPITTGMIVFFTSRSRPLFMEVQRRLDRLNTILQEYLSGVRVVKAFVRTEHENARFDKANTELLGVLIRVLRFLSILNPSIGLVLNLGTVAVIWLGGHEVVGGLVTPGEVVAFINYLITTTYPLAMMGTMVSQVSAAEASASRILEVLEDEPEIRDRPGALPLGRINGRVTFEDVTFHYNGREGEPVLSHISLVAEPGQTVAILGATGAGKSSMVSLIPRFYDVSAGRIAVDGIDIREVTTESLRSQIGTALQETILFTGTIRDNIRYGRPQASEDEVIAAARAAHAHDFIVDFPAGYDTMVGQRGVNLSGGQKQRIAIARALLVQPRILILDDSTSAVDLETESGIQDSLKRLMADRTSFIVAQRISTVLAADRIVVLDRGTVAAQGTHAELMAGSPIYREIYASQLGEGPSDGEPANV
ncbi:MAG: ABC transporter ATP-binding protein [Spirochaetia bacterium]